MTRLRPATWGLYIALVLWSIAASTVYAAQGVTPETGFVDAVARIGDRSLPYVIYVPREYTADRKWPVILFLHGAGERGSSGLPQTQVGIGAAIRLHPERFPCLVVMPQCPSGQAWAPIRPGAPDMTGVAAELAIAALDETIRKYGGDPDRIYLTGLSLGGYGTWNLGARHSEKFAALLPICGGGRPETMAPALKSMPIWVFHGEEDTTVPVERSREMVTSLKSAGNARVRYTELPGVGHNSWDAAYNSREAMAWLLSQRRGK